MKTPEEWRYAEGWHANTESLMQWIKAIQLDAWKEGLSGAASLARISNVNGKELASKLETIRDNTDKL